MPDTVTIENVSSKLPWKFSVGRRLLRNINYAVVHHDAVLAPDVYDPVLRYAHEADYHISKGWGHLAYHLRISRDGKIYQTLPFEEIGYHAGNWIFNRTGIGICLDGDLTRQPVTDAQSTALKGLMRHLAYERPDMPILLQKSFWAHKEVRGVGWPGTIAFIPNPTACPSPTIAQIVKAYRLSAPAG